MSGFWDPTDDSRVALGGEGKLTMRWVCHDGFCRKSWKGYTVVEAEIGGREVCRGGIGRGREREQEKSEERCWSRKVGGQAWSGGSLWKSVLKIEDQPRVLPDFL